MILSSGIAAGALVQKLLGGKINAVITVAAVMIVIYGIQAAKAIIVPFLLAAFLALITVRPMLWMQSRRVPAIIAALIILSGIMLLLFVIVTIVGTSVRDFANALPAYQARLESIVQGLLAFDCRLWTVDRDVECRKSDVECRSDRALLERVAPQKPLQSRRF